MSKAWEHRRASRHARGYGSAWDKLRLEILKRDILCQICLGRSPQRITPATEVDHITPKAKGGTDDPANLRAVCHPCHVRVSAAQRGWKPRMRVGLDGYPEPDD